VKYGVVVATKSVRNIEVNSSKKGNVANI